MKNDYTLDLEVAALKATIWVNDVKLSETADGVPFQFSVALNPWLKQGINECAITFDLPVPTGRETPEELAFLNGSKNRKLKVRISTAEGAETLWEYPPNKAKTVGFSLPQANPEVKGEFKIDDDVPAWSWERHPPVARVADVQEALFQSFLEIYSAFQSGNVDHLMALEETRNKEMALAFHMDPRDYAAAVRRDWDKTFPAQRPRPIPRLDGPHDLLFEAGWGGRLFKVLTLQSDYPLATEQDDQGMVISFDVYLGRIGANWRWVR